MELNRPQMILVVDDNGDDSFILLRLFEKSHLDYQVTVIESGKSALDYLLNSSPVPLALFLELRLPDLSGLAVLRAIRQEKRFDSMPVIVLTASSDPHDKEECDSLGVSAFLTKPISSTTFFTTIIHLFPVVNEAL